MLWEPFRDAKPIHTRSIFCVWCTFLKCVTVSLMGLCKCTHIHDAPITILYQRGAQHQTNGQGMCYHKFELGLAKPEVEQYRAEAYERCLVNASHALASEIIWMSSEAVGRYFWPFMAFPRLPIFFPTSLRRRFLSFTHHSFIHNSFTHNSFTHISFTHHSFTHISLTHISFTHITLSHTSLSHTSFSHTALPRTTLPHTSLSHTHAIFHTTLLHTTLSHTHTHNSFAHIPLTHNFVKHTQLFHTDFSHTTLSHITRLFKFSILHHLLCVSCLLRTTSSTVSDYWKKLWLVAWGYPVL